MIKQILSIAIDPLNWLLFIQDFLVKNEDIRSKGSNSQKEPYFRKIFYFQEFETTKQDLLELKIVLNYILYQIARANHDFYYLVNDYRVTIFFPSVCQMKSRKLKNHLIFVRNTSCRKQIIHGFSTSAKTDNRKYRMSLKIID